MHYADIIAALKKSDSSVKQVADDLNLAPPTVSIVIHGRGTSRRIASHIAKVTGIPLSKLFPGRYPADVNSLTAEAA